MNLQNKFSEIISKKTALSFEFIKEARRAGVAIWQYSSESAPEGFVRQVNNVGDNLPFCWREGFVIKVTSLGFVPDKLI